MKMLLIITTTLILTSCEFVKFWQIDHPDNKIEEIIEDLIEKKTGIEIDLTPVTGEEKQRLNFFEKSLCNCIKEKEFLDKINEESKYLYSDFNKKLCYEDIKR